MCGLDFATGQLPVAGGRGAPPPTRQRSTAEWVAVVSADHRYFESNQAESPDDTVTFPTDAEVREVPLTSNEILIGRRSDSKGIFPAIDLSEPPSDPGRVPQARRPAPQPDGDGWSSTRGRPTAPWCAARSPPIKPGDAVRLHDGDHLHVGAWTRITLRRVGAPT